ncbi:hypothetical protein JNB11_07690 [Kocuria palustris]|nr:hypothetical protein [Kocuria palustris]
MEDPVGGECDLDDETSNPALTIAHDSAALMYHLLAAQTMAPPSVIVYHPLSVL